MASKAAWGSRLMSCICLQYLFSSSNLVVIGWWITAQGCFLPHMNSWMSSECTGQPPKEGKDKIIKALEDKEARHYLENLAAWRVTTHIFTRMEHAQSDTVQENHQHAEPFKPGAQEVSQGNQSASQKIRSRSSWSSNSSSLNGTLKLTF
ncbi:hypothetical protein lerEdw1_017731 [Lerista edwardsae]|nr:hypothetical protein lerEdw1_017731 [Lerista edwardsae]